MSEQTYKRCNNAVMRNMNPTGERCSKPEGHKSVCADETGSLSASTSSVSSTGRGSSHGPIRVVLDGMTVGSELYLSARSVEMLLMDMHLRARNDGERELAMIIITELREACRGTK